MEIRDRLREYIEQDASLSFSNVAKKAGLSNSAIHKFCSGQVHSMTLDNLKKIAAAMDVSFRWLLHGDGAAESSNNIAEIFDKIPETHQPLAINILRQMTTIDDDMSKLNPTKE